MSKWLRKQNAAQLAAQLREAGQHEKADEIESLLAQAAQAANEETPVAQLAVEEPVELSVEEEAKEIMTERVEKVENLIQDKRDREQELHRALSMVEALRKNGKAKEAAELVSVITSLAESSSKDIDHAHALDGLDGVILKIDHQKQMIGDYIESLEDCIPQDSADLTAWDDVEEMCGFLQVYTNVLQQQKELAENWVSMLNIPSAKDAYTSKLDDANEVIKMATCISLQLQQLAASVQIKAVQQDMQGEKAAEQAP